jgi:hypothetical protein
VGSLEIELSFDNGDDATLTAQRVEFFNSLLGVSSNAIFTRRRDGIEGWSIEQYKAEGGKISNRKSAAIEPGDEATPGKTPSSDQVA